MDYGYKLLCIEEDSFVYDNKIVLNIFFRNYKLVFKENELIDLLEKEEFDILILNISSYKQGINVLTLIKRYLPNIEIIIISLDYNCYDLLLSLDYRVRKFLKIPIKSTDLYNAINCCITELQQVNNIKKFLEKSENLINDNNHIYITNELILDLNKREIRNEYNIISLTDIETKIFMILIEHQSHIVKYDYLRNKIWQKKDISNSTIRTSIYKIRSKLSSTNFINLDIKTVAMSGYILSIE